MLKHGLCPKTSPPYTKSVCFVRVLHAPLNVLLGNQVVQIHHAVVCDRTGHVSCFPDKPATHNPKRPALEAATPPLQSSSAPPRHQRIDGLPKSLLAPSPRIQSRRQLRTVSCPPLRGSLHSRWGCPLLGAGRAGCVSGRKGGSRLKSVLYMF